MKTKMLLAMALGSLALGAGQAQSAGSDAEWPSRPLRLTVPSTAGSAPDIMARLLGEKIGKDLGTTVVVENKPGAGGVIGLASVKNSTRNDHDFVFAPASVFSMTPFLYPSKQVDVVADFEPVTLVAMSPMMIAVKGDSPMNSLADLIQAARASSDFIVSTTAQFTLPHLTSDVLAKAADAPLRAVPYSTSAGSMGAVVNGDAQAVIDGIPPLESMVQAGKLKALAVFSEERLPNRDKIPTAKETIDSPSMIINGWFAIVAPKGTSAAAIDKVSASLAKVVNDPDVQKVFDTLGVYASPSTPAEFGKFWSNERARWSQVLTEVGAPVKAQ